MLQVTLIDILCLLAQPMLLLTHRNSVSAGHAYVAVDCLTESLCLLALLMLLLTVVPKFCVCRTDILCLLALSMLLLTLIKLCVYWPSPCCC